METTVRRFTKRPNVGNRVKVYPRERKIAKGESYPPSRYGVVVRIEEVPTKEVSQLDKEEKDFERMEILILKETFELFSAHSADFCLPLSQARFEK